MKIKRIICTAVALSMLLMFTEVTRAETVFTTTAAKTSVVRSDGVGCFNGGTTNYNNYYFTTASNLKYYCAYRYDISSIGSNGIDSASLTLYFKPNVPPPNNTVLKFFVVENNDFTNSTTYSGIKMAADPFFSVNINIADMAADGSYVIDFIDAVQYFAERGISTFNFAVNGTPPEAVSSRYGMNPAMFPQVKISTNSSLRPRAEITSPAASVLSPGENISFAAISHDDDSTDATLQLFVDGEQVASDGTYSLGALSEGNHVLKAVAQDSDGNIGITEKTVTVSSAGLEYKTYSVPGSINDVATVFETVPDNSLAEFYNIYIGSGETGYYSLFRYNISNYIKFGLKSASWNIKLKNAPDSNFTLRFYDVTDESWTRNTTWNKRPKWSSEPVYSAEIDASVIDASEKLCSVDITELVKRYINEGRKIVNFAVGATSESGSRLSLDAYSAVTELKLTTTSNQRPSIAIVSPQASNVSPDGFRFAVEVTDDDESLPEVSLYLDGKRLSGVVRSGNEYSVSIGAPGSGMHELKATATDSYAEISVLKKQVSANDYLINSVKYTDLNGAAIVPMAGDTVKCTLNITSFIPEPTDAAVIIAVYDADNSLAAFNSESIQIAPGAYDYGVQLTVPEGYGDGYRLVSYIWTSIGFPKPLGGQMQFK